MEWLQFVSWYTMHWCKYVICFSLFFLLFLLGLKWLFPWNVVLIYWFTYFFQTFVTWLLQSLLKILKLLFCNNVFSGQFTTFSIPFVLLIVKILVNLTGKLLYKFWFKSADCSIKKVNHYWHSMIDLGEKEPTLKEQKNSEGKVKNVKSKS